MAGFQPFDPRGALRKARRDLPHWRQPGATYFVTFRLADSLPREVVARFEELRRLNDDNQAFPWIEEYLDAGAGECPLGNPANARVVADSLRFFDGQRYELGPFVVMPNHVHVLVQPISGSELSGIVHGWKSFTAHQLQRMAGLAGKIWQTESFDRIVRDEAELRKFSDYIRRNPSAARLDAGMFVTGSGSARWLEPPP